MKIGYNNTSGYQLHIILHLIIKCLRGLCKKTKYKSKNLVAFGKNVTIDGKKRDFRIGKNVKIEAGTYIQTTSQNGITLGNNVTICQNSIIRPSGFYGGNLGWGLVLGSYSSIGAGSYIGCSGKITIGNYVMIGPHCTMIAENHNYADVTKNMIEQGVNNKGIEIKDNVWIGANVTILDGVIIESGCVLAAGAVVTKSTMPNGIYAGVPAKLIKTRV